MNAYKNLTMLMDFYEMTMANGYFEHGFKDSTVCYDMFFRKVPDEGGFAIMGGLRQLIDYIKELKFEESDIEYFRSKNIFSEEFLDYLREFEFSCDVCPKSAFVLSILLMADTAPTNNSTVIALLSNPPSRRSAKPSSISLKNHRMMAPISWNRLTMMAKIRMPPRRLQTNWVTTIQAMRLLSKRLPARKLAAKPLRVSTTVVRSLRR